MDATNGNLLVGAIFLLCVGYVLVWRAENRWLEYLRSTPFTRLKAALAIATGAVAAVWGGAQIFDLVTCIVKYFTS